MHGSKVGTELKDQILAAVAAGESYRDIGKWALVSSTTVTRLVHAERVEKQQKIPIPRLGSLGLDDRISIVLGIKQDLSNAKIAAQIGFHPGSVGREINKNGGRDVYDAVAAQLQADQNKKRPRDNWTQTRPWLWDKIQQWLRLCWSPQQIANRLRKDHPDDEHWHVSHESIYDAIFVQAKPELAKELKTYLRSGRVKRVPQSRKSNRGRPSIKNKINISERPAEADDRAVPGHWEGDLIVGLKSQSYIATLVERTTRFGILIKLDSKNAVHVGERISETIKRLAPCFARSLTWDCGTELADHQTITATANIDVYFCDPHSPWQRGSNENWNGLVRQFLPKGTDLSTHTQDELDHIAHLLNTRPRHTLNWDTPAEQFNQLIATTT